MIQVGIPEGMGVPVKDIQVDQHGHVILSDADVERVAQRVRSLVRADCPCCGYPECGHDHGSNIPI
jgi:hypothetical protein